jgi:hypothetical protein
MGTAGMTTLRKPTLATIAAPDQLLTMLVGYYDALLELRKDLLPSRTPALKAVTQPLYADLRMNRGDVMGELGPRATIVTGGTAVLDGGQGAFVWDPSSKTADDGVNTFEVAGVNPGRWRRTAL